MTTIPCNMTLLKANHYYGFGTNHVTTAYLQANHRHCAYCGWSLTINTLCFWFQSGQTPPQFCFQSWNHGISPGQRNCAYCRRRSTINTLYFCCQSGQTPIWFQSQSWSHIISLGHLPCAYCVNIGTGNILWFWWQSWHHSISTVRFPCTYHGRIGTKTNYSFGSSY